MTQLTCEDCEEPVTMHQNQWGGKYGKCGCEARSVKFSSKIPGSWS